VYHRAFASVGEAAVVLVALTLCLAPPALAEPRPMCGPQSAEDEVVRVFPRIGGESVLRCGNRWFGFRRIDWGAVSDDAVARTLLAPRTRTYDDRGETWTWTGEPGGVDVVITAAHGEIVTARPAAP
jgi:hypothetical protein